MTHVNDHYAIKNKIVVDFSKMENITLKSLDAVKKEKQVYKLNFKMSPNNTITKYVSEKDRNLPEIPERVGETLIPISTNCCDEFDYKEINNKILHAFNELRILSQTN